MNVPKINEAVDVFSYCAANDLPFNQYTSPLTDLLSIANYLKDCKHYNCPKKIRTIAKQLQLAHQSLKLAQAKFNFAVENKKSEKARQVEKELLIFNRKTSSLFKQLKKEYLKWYDENVPAYRKLGVSFVFPDVDGYDMLTMYNYFKLNYWDLSKQTTVFTNGIY